MKIDKSDKIEIIVDCIRCKQNHSYFVPVGDLDKGLDLFFLCPNIKRLPKINSFRVDFTRNTKVLKEKEKEEVAFLYGQFDIEAKLARRNEINETKMWLIHDFDNYFEEIVRSYIGGSFYPVAASCTTLAERIVNLFIIKMRDLYPKNVLNLKLQKYVYTRNQNWQSFDDNMKVLFAWKILSTKQKKMFKDLLNIRNRAVHFQTNFDPKKDSLEAVKTLHSLIDSYFSLFSRKDILRVFEIPGEIWVKEENMIDPFVKAFVLPCCFMSASCGSTNKDGLYHENDAIIGEFSEKTFIEQRKKYQASLGEERNDLSYVKKIKKFTVNGKSIKVAIV